MRISSFQCIDPRIEQIHSKVHLKGFRGNIDRENSVIQACRAGKSSKIVKIVGKILCFRNFWFFKNSSIFQKFGDTMPVCWIKWRNTRCGEVLVFCKKCRCRIPCFEISFWELCSHRKIMQSPELCTISKLPCSKLYISNTHKETSFNHRKIFPSRLFLRHS